MQAKLFADADGYICFHWCCAYLHQHFIDPSSQNNSDFAVWISLIILSPKISTGNWKILVLFLWLLSELERRRRQSEGASREGEKVTLVRGGTHPASRYRRGTDWGALILNSSGSITLTRVHMKWKARGPHSPELPTALASALGLCLEISICCTS